MHTTTDRYVRDRQRHDLALRMIRHEARTCTIRTCTALTDDRIRRLCKTYARQYNVRRRRGKAPRQVAFFTRTVHMQFEASLLTSVFGSFGLLRAPGACIDRPSLEYGQLFCDAYETHLQLLQTARISFEHAWFLLQLLARGGALKIMKCRHCYSRYLRDGLNVARLACPVCELKTNSVDFIAAPAAHPDATCAHADSNESGVDASDTGMPPQTG
jgi:hypothetical protein